MRFNREGRAHTLLFVGSHVRRALPYNGYAHNDTPNDEKGSNMAARHMAPYAHRRRRKSPVVPILLCLVVLAAAGVGGYFAYRHFTTINVTVNGRQVAMRSGDTAEQLLLEGYASPSPGNLLAIDGELLQEGGGERCTVTINGSTSSLSAPLSANAVVSIEDGKDLTEDSTTSEEAIPFKTSEGDRSFGAYWNGSIHLLADGKEGTRTIRTGSVSGKTMEEGTTQPVDAGYLIYTARPANRAIALTFDDGPWPQTTDAILDILEQNNAKATFFVIGNQVANYAAQVKRADSMGCQICTHSWDHAAGSGQGVSLATMSADEQVMEVQKGYAAIADVLGEEPAHILRAPGGNFYGDTITNLWSYVDAEIGWDVDTEDWRRPGVDAIYDAIMTVQPGQVVLMHDGGGERSQTVEALRKALPKLAEQGYTFVTVDELLSYGVPA